MKILLAVDGSQASKNAVTFAIKLIRQCSGLKALTLIHADQPLLNAAAIKLGPEAVKRYHDENNQYATKAARSSLNRAKIPFTELLLVGEPAEAIVEHGRKGRFDIVIMGSRGHGALRGLLLGSVTSKVLANGTIPVTIVH